MKLRNPLILGAAILFAGFVTIATYEAFGALGIALLFFIVFLFVTAVLFAFRRGALVDEMEVGVIFNRINNSFLRFAVSPEPEPVRQLQRTRKPGWIPFGRRVFTINDPYLVRLHWYEEVRGTIPKKSLTAKGKLENIRTADGIPVTVSWKVSYTVDVNLITETIKHKMARALPDNSDKIVSGRAERAIKHLFELRSIQTLYAINLLDGSGAIQNLEQEICQRVNRQLSQPVNLGFKEIKPKDVSLGPIEVPPKVEKALELAHQRKIHTETVAGALERLQIAVAGFNAQDMHHLAELERLRILDEKDIKSLNLADSFVQLRH